MESRSYKVTSPIRFGGRICNIGESVSLTDAEAAQFTGCIELSDPEENAVSDELLLTLDELRQENDKLGEELRQLKGQLETVFQENDKNVGLLQERDKTLAARDKAIEGMKTQIAKLKEKPAGKAPGLPPKTDIPA